MAITYGDLLQLVQHTLQDETGVTYPTSLIYDAICGSIDAIMPWAPKQNVVEIVGDGAHKSYVIPGNIYRIEGVQEVSTGYFSERMLLNPSSARKVNGSYATHSWLEYPRGILLFSDILDVDKVYRAYVLEHYEKPATETDTAFVVGVPQAVKIGMVYWACSHCVIPGSLTDSQIRQFGTRVDSGKPTDNALGEQAKFLRMLFLDEMSRVPKQPGIIT